MRRKVAVGAVIVVSLAILEILRRLVSGFGPELLVVLVTGVGMAVALRRVREHFA